jgi:ADP-ribosylation factor-like protein 3
MPTQIILTYFDSVVGPQVFYTKPPPIDPYQESIITNLMDLKLSKGFFTVTKEKYILMNYGFEITSPLARGSAEIVLLTISLERETKNIDWDSLLKEFTMKIAEIPLIYKIFHTEVAISVDLSPIKAKLDALFDEYFQKVVEIDEHIYLGQILMLGIEKVGKTTIGELLKTGHFDANTKPTLGTQVLQTLIDNFRFRIFDVGGQKSIRSHWFKNVKYPNGVIYMIDLSRPMDDTPDYKYEFNRIMAEFYFSKEKRPKSDIPLLIIANKSDLVPDLNKKEEIQKITEHFGLKTLDIPYEIWITSAKAGDGIKESFQWLVQKIVFS